MFHIFILYYICITIIKTNNIMATTKLTIDTLSTEVDTNIIEFAKKFGKKQAYLYNNRILRGIINPTDKDKAQYDINWKYIKSI